MNFIIEELTQRITAIAADVRRYRVRVDSYRQNKLFEKNQRQLYRGLDQEEERCDEDQPVAEESKQFWGNIYGVSLQIIRTMQSGYKTCKKKLMLKNRRR